MKRQIWTFLIILSALLAACASVGTTEPGTTLEAVSSLPPPTEGGSQTTPPPEPTTSSPAETPIEVPETFMMVRDKLAGLLGLPVDQIELRSSEFREFRDGCLGAARPDEMCTQVITPGYRLVFETPFGEYVFHTNDPPTFSRLAEYPNSVIWERSGGFAGICQRLIIFLDGRYLIQDCRLETTLGEGELPADELATWEGYLERYGMFLWNIELPEGAANMFLDRYVFLGNGNQIPGTEEQVEINDMLAELQRNLLSR